MATFRFLALILLCLGVGEFLVAQLTAPVPGAVVGMGLLLAWLAWSGGPGDEVEETVLGLLRHMSLLFVPAGVGIIVYISALGESALGLIVAITVSTLLTIAVVGRVMQSICRRTAATPQAGREPDRPAHHGGPMEWRPFRRRSGSG